MPDAATLAKLAEIDRRYKRKRRGKPVSLAALRVRDLRVLYAARYGSSLPDDDAGLDDARLMAHHLAALSGDPRRRLDSFIREWCPWMSRADQDALLVEIMTRPQRWRADKLAWRLRLIEADRSTLKITTIGAIDMGKAERTKRRRARARMREQERRAAKGAKPRARYLASTIGKPWIAAGISRASWYRQRARET